MPSGITIEINYLSLQVKPTNDQILMDQAGNTKGESITVLLTSCLTGLDQSVLETKQKLSVVIQLILNQSNRRSTVQ